MSIAKFFNKTLTISRMVWANESSSESVITTFSGHLQQASAELAESLGLSFTKTFSLWCDKSIEVKEQDSLSDGTYTYLVRAINSRNYSLSSNNEHLQLILERVEIV